MVDLFNENCENHEEKFIQEQHEYINNRADVALKPSAEIFCPGSLVLFDNFDTSQQYRKASINTC